MNLACLKRLSVLSLVNLLYSCNSIAIQFAIKEQVKDLTHMFCFQIPCYKLYKKDMFSHVFTIKYIYHFGMNSKKLNLKAKHEMKKKSWLFFSSFSLVFSYLLTYLSKYVGFIFLPTNVGGG